MAQRRHLGLIWLAVLVALSGLIAPLAGQNPAPLAAQPTAAAEEQRYNPIRANPVGGALVCAPHEQINGQALRVYYRPDYRKEVYIAAGDPYLEYGLRQLDRYWSGLDASLLRGYVDGLLPIELRRLNHRGANSMMLRFRQYLERQREPRTGLIPYTNNEFDEKLGIYLGNRQTLRMLPLMAELLAWFPNDPATLQTVRAMADTTIRHFDVPPREGRPAGLVDWVRVDEPDDAARSYLAQDLAGAARGATAVGVATGEDRYLNWANQKMLFLWAERTNPPLPLLAERLTSTGWDRSSDDIRTSDSDTLYSVQELFETARLSNNPRPRNYALKVTDWWYEHAWLAEYGQFVRKLNRADGEAHEPRIYGDAKYNVLFVLVHAYSATGETKYLERFKEAWAGMLRSGGGEFVPETIIEGQYDQEQGLDPAQSFFVEALVSAYQASGDQEFLALAEEFAGRLMSRRPDLIRETGGQGANAYVRLGLARNQIGRLTVDLNSCGAPRAQIQIQQDGRTIINTPLYADLAIIYLPVGTYRIRTVNPVGEQTMMVTVTEYNP